MPPSRSPSRSATERFEVVLALYEAALDEARAAGIEEPESIGLDSTRELGDKPLFDRIRTLVGELIDLRPWVLAEREKPPENMVVIRSDDGAVIGNQRIPTGRDREVAEQVEAEMAAEAFARRRLPVRPIASARRGRSRPRQRQSRRARAPARSRSSDDDPHEPDLVAIPISAFRAEVASLLGGRP